MTALAIGLYLVAAVVTYCAARRDSEGRLAAAVLAVAWPWADGVAWIPVSED